MIRSTTFATEVEVLTKLAFLDASQLGSVRLAQVSASDQVGALHSREGGH